MIEFYNRIDNLPPRLCAFMLLPLLVLVFTIPPIPRPPRLSDEVLLIKGARLLFIFVLVALFKISWC